MSVPPCGTDRGYQRHHKRREPIDDACRDAHAAKMADYRASRGRPSEVELLERRARTAALRDLREQHALEFEVLLHAHRQRLGIGAGVE